MKSASTFLCAMLCLPASGAIKYWDINNTTIGAGGSSPAGIWDQGTTPNWSTTSAGDAATTTFLAGDAAIFAAGNEALGSYTITVNGLVSPSAGLVVKDGTVLMGGTGTIGVGGGSVIVSNGAVLVYALSSKFTVTAGNALVLDNGSVRITGAAGSAVWNAIGDLRIGSGGGTFDVSSGLASYTGSNGITLTAGSSEATVTKIGSGEFRPLTCAFTRLIVNQGLWRVPGTGGLETGFGAVPASFVADALSINGGAVGTSANLVTPANRGITLGSGGGTFVVSAPWTINSVVTGLGGLTLNGNGFTGSPTQPLTLAGANTYQGNTTINPGNLSIGSDDNLGNAPLAPVANAIVLGGGTLNINNSFTLNPNRGIQLSASSTIEISSGEGLVYSGVISAAANTFGLTKTASGTLTLGGVNTFGGGAGGDLTITGGTVNFNHDNAAGAGKIVVTPSSAVTLRNSVAATTLANPIVLNAGTAAIDMLATAGNRLTLSGAISGSGALTRGNGGGSGKVTLGGNNVLWSGGLDHRGGTLELGHRYALGTGALNVSGTKLSTTALQASAGLTGGNAPTNAVNLNTNVIFGGVNEFELAGPLNLGSAVTLTVTNPNTILSGTISGTGVGLTKAGEGVLTLAEANSYIGPTLVAEGTLEVANPSGSATGAGAITVAAAATIKGPGATAGMVDLDGTISPGASVGTLATGPETWAGGGAYRWEFDDALGGAGTEPGWDHLRINGGLKIAATSDNKFTIRIESKALGGGQGGVVNFSSALDYRWLMASVTESITNFAAEAFTLDTSGFSNSIAGGRFSLAVENTTNLVILFVSNRPPIAVTDSLSRPRGVSMKIRKTDLLANDTDAENYPLAFVGAGPASTNNAVITSDATFVYYQPLNGDPANDVIDSFSYTITDGFLTGSGTVVVNITADSTAPVPSIVAYAPASDGNLSITFAGVPGRSYLVQATPSLAPPIVWETLTNNLTGGTLFSAGTNGLWKHTDLNSTNFGIRFYRSSLP